MRSIGIMMKLLTFSTVLLSLTIGCKKEQNTDQQSKVEQYPGYKTIIWSDLPPCPKEISVGSFMVGTGGWIGPALGKSPGEGPIRVQEGPPTHATITLLEDGLAKYEAEVPPGCKLEPQLVMMPTGPFMSGASPTLAIAPGSVLFLKTSHSGN